MSVGISVASVERKVLWVYRGVKRLEHSNTRIACDDANTPYNASKLHQKCKNNNLTKTISIHYSCEEKNEKYVTC